MQVRGSSLEEARKTRPAALAGPQGRLHVCPLDHGRVTLREFAAFWRDRSAAHALLDTAFHGPSRHRCAHTHTMQMQVQEAKQGMRWAWLSHLRPWVTGRGAVAETWEQPSFAAAAPPLMPLTRPLCVRALSASASADMASQLRSALSVLLCCTTLSITMVRI